MKSFDNNYTPRADESIRKILNTAYYTFTVEAIDGSGRQPGSKAEVEAVKKLMNKAKTLHTNDPELLEEIAQYEFICEEAYERRFVGFIWLIIFVAIYAVFFIWNGFSTLGDKKDYTVEYVTPLYKYDIEGDQMYIARYDTVKDLEKEELAYLEKRKEALDEKLQMNMDDYVSYKKSQANWNAFSDFRTALFWSVMIFLYYKATLAPVFLINKRQQDSNIVGTGISWFKRIFLFFLGLFIALPVNDKYNKVKPRARKVVTKSSGISPWFVVKLIGLIMVSMLLLIIALISMPILTLIGYLRNYKYEAVDAFFDRATDSVKGVLKIA